VVDDRSRLIVSHREYVNHLKLTHQAAQDIKDNKSVPSFNQKYIFSIYNFLEFVIWNRRWSNCSKK